MHINLFVFEYDVFIHVERYTSWWPDQRRERIERETSECGGNRSICQDVVCFLVLLLLKGKAPQLDTLLAGVKAQNMPMVQLLLHRKADVNGQEKGVEELVIEGFVPHLPAFQKSSSGRFPTCNMSFVQTLGILCNTRMRPCRLPCAGFSISKKMVCQEIRSLGRKMDRLTKIKYFTIVYHSFASRA